MKDKPQKRYSEETAVSGLKKRILFVDDDPGIRDIVAVILSRAGYELEVKEDGTDILKNKFILPDLFLIDKQLSGINGLDLCRHLKQRKATSHIPVIMISASPDIAILSKQAGADTYIEKPFNVHHFLTVISSCINPVDSHVVI